MVAMRAHSPSSTFIVLAGESAARVEHCCFSEAPLFKERLPNESGELEEDGSEPSMEFVSCLVISLCFFYSISNLTPHLSSNIVPCPLPQIQPFSGICINNHFPVVHA